jgi:hypothetical protein
MALLPELPDAKRERFRSENAMTDDHAKSLTSEIKVANIYEQVAKEAPSKLAAVWVADVLKGELNYRSLTIDSFKPELYGRDCEFAGLRHDHRRCCSSNNSDHSGQGSIARADSERLGADQSRI